MFEGKLEQAVGSFDAKLAGDIGAMRFNRSRTDEELGCNFPGSLFLGNGFEDAAFRCGEVCECRSVSGERLGAISAFEKESA